MGKDENPEPPGDAAPADATRSRARRKVGRGAVINLIGDLMALLDPLFLVTVSWLLGAETLGVYVLATIYAFIVLRLGLLGLDKGLLRHIPMARASADPDRALASVLGTALRGILGSCLVGTVAVFLLADLIMSRGGGDTTGEGGRWLAWIVFAVPGEGLLFFFLFAIRGLADMRPFVLVRKMLGPILLFAIAVPCILLGLEERSLVIAYLGSRWGGALVAGIVFARKFPGMNPIRLIRAPWDRAMLSFSLPQGLTEFLGYITARVDIIMIGFFLPERPEILAYYSVSALIAGVVRKVQQGFNTSMAPVLSDLIVRSRKGEVLDIYRKTGRWMFTLFLLVALTVTIISPLVLTSFGPGYSEWWLLVPLLALARFMSNAGGPAQMSLLMAGRSKLELLNNVLINGLNVLLNALLIPLYGPWGAAVATLTSLTVFNLMRMVQISRILHVVQNPWSVLGIMLSGALASLPALGVLLLPVGVWKHGVAGVLFVLAYPLGLWIVGYRDDMMAVWNHITRKKGARPG